MTTSWWRRFDVEGLRDADKLRRARLMMFADLALAVFLLAVAGEGIADRNPFMISLASLFSLLGVAGFSFARRGRLAAAEWSTSLLILLVTVAVIATQGPASPRLWIIHVGVIFLGLAVRPWMAPALAAGASALVIATTLAQQAGVQLPLAPSGQPHWLAMVRAVALTGVLVAAFARGFRRLYDELQRHTVDLEKAHAELVAAGERLERLVVQRTAELQQTNADLEVFASSVSHDLRSPLRQVHAFLDLFLADAGALGDARLAPVLEVRAAAAALSSQVKSLLVRQEPPRT